MKQTTLNELDTLRDLLEDAAYETVGFSEKRNDCSLNGIGKILYGAMTLLDILQKKEKKGEL